MPKKAPSKDEPPVPTKTAVRFAGPSYDTSMIPRGAKILSAKVEGVQETPVAVKLERCECPECGRVIFEVWYMRNPTRLEFRCVHCGIVDIVTPIEETPKKRGRDKEHWEKERDEK
jgi:predicted RNA-binding Zn-ribbon protein involved in translation (DUF1610 family)